jgi:hypothetical protein
LLDCNDCALHGYCIPDECADATKRADLRGNGNRLTIKTINTIISQKGVAHNANQGF